MSSPRASQIVTKQVESLKPDTSQPRKYWDLTDLKALGRSMIEHGQLQPVGARPDGTLIWGERRYRAALEVGIKTLQVIITDRPLSEGEIRLLQLVENTHRADLRPAERAHALSEIQKLHGWNNTELAQHSQMEVSLVGRYLSLFNCVTSVQAAAVAGNLGVSAWHNISLLPTDEQQALLELYLSGASRDQIASISRRKRNGEGNGDTIRLSRIKCPLPSGVKVTVAGKDLALADFIEALSELLKEAKRAADQGLDIRTLAAVTKDKAKSR